MVSFVGVLCVLAVLAVRLLMVFFGDVDNLFPLVEADVLYAGLAEATSRIFGFFFCIGALAIIPQGKQNKGSTLVVVLAVAAVAAVSYTHLLRAYAGQPALFFRQVL